MESTERYLGEQMAHLSDHKHSVWPVAFGVYRLHCFPGRGRFADRDGLVGDSDMNTSGHSLNISCPSFGVDGQIPKKHTGFGEDISPAFSIEGLRSEVKTLAVMMDDRDVPFYRELNHWLIWNLPPEDSIPENIPYGAECPNGAKQGLAYGKHRLLGQYRGKLSYFNLCFAGLSGKRRGQEDC